MNDPETRVIELAHALDLSEDTRELAREYAIRAWYEYPVNRSAEAIAAGAVYMAALVENEKRTQPAVCAVADCGETALRNAYHAMWEYEFPESHAAMQGDTSDADAGRGWSMSDIPIREVAVGILTFGIPVIVVIGFVALVVPHMGMTENVDAEAFKMGGATFVGFGLVYLALVVFILASIPYLPGIAGRRLR